MPTQVCVHVLAGEIELGNQNLPEFIDTRYEVREWKHAIAILSSDFPDEWNDVVEVLSEFRLLKSSILTPGGGKSPIARALDNAFYDRGWEHKSFETAIEVDTDKIETPTHKIDCYRNEVGLEIEWNNKDPFYDRDLNNFRLLFELRALHVGIIVTRSDELQDLFDELGKGKSYGGSTTHMSKLLPRIDGGGAGGCPVLVFGITRKLYTEDI